MSTLIIHLSDLHLKDGTFLERAKLISAAALSPVTDLKAICVIISGDIANWGSAKEFSFGKEFIEELQTEILCRSEILPQIIVCPGNHDCDFSGDQSVRDVLLASVRANPKAISPAIVSKLSSVLENFNSFQRDVSPEVEIISPWMAKAVVHSPDNIIIVLLNSAITSAIKEEYGKLYVPIQNLTLLHRLHSLLV